MENSFTTLIVNNIRKIMNDRGLKQSSIAEYADTTASQFSKILNGDVKLSLAQLSNIATGLEMREIDIITYPDVYVKKDNTDAEPVEVVLQIKLQKDKKDQVLKLAFGDNNLEILNNLFDLPIPKEAHDIISKYRGKDWLLSPLDKYSDYKDFLHHWNDALKKIRTKDVVPDKTGKRRKIVYKPLFPTLTVYSARYSFASIGAELDIPRETIALCLGHSWADVTSHYIAYDTKKIDKAVRQVIDYLDKFNAK